MYKCPDDERRYPDRTRQHSTQEKQNTTATAGRIKLIIDLPRSLIPDIIDR